MCVYIYIYPHTLPNKPKSIAAVKHLTCSSAFSVTISAAAPSPSCCPSLACSASKAWQRWAHSIRARWSSAVVVCWYVGVGVSGRACALTTACPLFIFIFIFTFIYLFNFLFNRSRRAHSRNGPRIHTSIHTNDACMYATRTHPRTHAPSSVSSSCLSRSNSACACRSSCFRGTCCFGFFCVWLCRRGQPTHCHVHQPLLPSHPRRRLRFRTSASTAAAASASALACRSLSCAVSFSSSSDLIDRGGAFGRSAMDSAGTVSRPSKDTNHTYIQETRHTHTVVHTCSWP